MCKLWANSDLCRIGLIMGEDSVMEPPFPNPYRNMGGYPPETFLRIFWVTHLLAFHGLKGA